MCPGFRLPTLLKSDGPATTAIRSPQKLWIRFQSLPSMICYELPPQGVNGLRKFSTTALRRFGAPKISSKEPRWAAPSTWRIGDGAARGSERRREVIEGEGEKNRRRRETRAEAFATPIHRSPGGSRRRARSGGVWDGRGRAPACAAIARCRRADTGPARWSWAPTLRLKGGAA